MSSRRSLFTVIASAYLLNSAGRVADVFWLLLLFTVLPVDQVAVFALASAVAAFFAMGLDAGLNQTLLREFSSQRLTLSRGIGIATGARLTLLAVAVIVGGLWIYFAQPAGDLIAVIAVACSVQLWMLIEQFCQQWLKANDRQTTANALAATEPFLKLAAVGLLALTDDSVKAIEFFIAQNAYHCLLAIACVVACRFKRSGVVVKSQEPLPAILRASSWFALMGLITVVQNRVDWLLVANFTGEAATASYSLVNRAYEVMMMLIGTGAMTLFPLLCRERQGRDSGGMPVFRKTVLAGGVLAAGVAAVVLPEFCNWIWKDKYVGADLLFATLMPIACLSTFIQLMYYEAIASRSEAKLVMLGLFSTGAQVLANVTLIPLWGTAGAVIGMVVLATTNIGLYFYNRGRLGLPSLSSMMPLACYACVMAATWLFTATMLPNLWLRLTVGVVLWTLLSYGWLLSTSERASLKGALSSMRMRLVPAGTPR